MKINYLLCIMILLVSCTKEDALVSREFTSASSFEFPQGDKEYDHELVKLYERFDVRCIYEGMTNDDLNRSWGGNALDGLGNYGKPLDTDELRHFYTIFFRDNVFKYFEPEIVNSVLPRYIFFIQDGFLKSTFGTNPDGSPIIKETAWRRFYGGMDFWSFSFLSELHYSTATNTWQDFLPKVTLDYIKFKEPVLKSIIDKLLKSGVIKQPEFLSITSATDLDYVTEVQTNINQIGLPNYFKRRGFPELLRNTLNYVAPSAPTNSGGKVRMTPSELFVDYLWLGVRYSREQIQINYAQFPLVLKYYDMVADYMMQNYKIDLNEMAEEPQLIN